MKKHFMAQTILVVLSILMTACASPAAEIEQETAIPTIEEAVEEVQSESPVEDASKVAVYISPDSLGVALEEAFEAEHGDVIDIIGGPWCRKLKSEQEAGEIQADIIYGAEPIFFMELADVGALLAYTPSEAANSIEAYQWDNGYYSVADLRYLGIVYNSTLVAVEDLPQTYDGMNNAKWQNFTAVPDATQCSAAFAILAALTQPDLDMSFFENAKANGTLLSDRAGKLPEMVASGEAAIGVGPHDPVVRLQNKAKKEGVESPVNITWSEDGTYVIPRPIAVIADENRSDADTEIAQMFVDFVLSAKGQAIIVKKGGFMPVRAGMEGPALIPTDLELLQLDWNWAYENSAQLKSEFQAIMFAD